jgi:diguanylate cyclase (GGDEF)-like protein/PAS domain S-box-containing protein
MPLRDGSKIFSTGPRFNLGLKTQVNILHQGYNQDMATTMDFPIIRLSSDFIRAKEYLEMIVSSSPDAICTTDISGRFIYFSPGAEAMMGFKMEKIIGRFASEIYAEGAKEARSVMRALRERGKIKNHETILKGNDDRVIHASLAASLLKDHKGATIGTLGIFKDITERVNLEKRLQELCRTDNLTGLSNRRHFSEALKLELLRAKRQGYPLSLVLMDLDGFKSINDRFGHKAGDRLLKSFSALLRDSLRQGVDLTFRYGGDEFTAILPGLPPSQAEGVMQRILRALETRPEKSRIAFSYGIAGSPPFASPARLIQSADAAMYKMKKSGK